MYYCGIDVAKRKHVAILLDEQGDVVMAAFRLSYNRQGFGALIELLNPMQVHAYSRTAIRRRKSDRLDAYWVADYIRIASWPVTSIDTPVLLQLRELTRFRHRLTQQIGDGKRKMICILDRVFPEYETPFSDVFLASSRQLLSRAVTAEDFAEFDLQELADVLSRASKGRFGLPKARSIQDLAQQSVGVGFLSDAVHVEMRCLLSQVDLLMQQRDEIDGLITQLMDELNQHVTILSYGLTTTANGRKASPMALPWEL